MTILLTGGGSGGHITPLLAVARELKKKSPKSRLHYVGERGSQFDSLLDNDRALFEKTSTVYSGKLRRYHGESWLKRAVDIKTILLNIRDVFLVSLGFLQSLFILALNRPDIIFIKGGYVGLPLGLAARLLRVPYITHDSDAVAGLTNRLIGKGARVNAVGMRGGSYPYPKDKIKEVGVPCRDSFKRLNKGEAREVKRKLDLLKNGQVLLITGGSQGARRINEALANTVASIFDNNQDLTIVHQMGKGNGDQYGSYNHPRLRKLEFIDNLEEYSGVSDLIITRAGASTLAEYARQEKPCIVVPSPYLAGGHQLRNAETLDKAGAAVILSEKQLADSQTAQKTIQNLLADPVRRAELGKNLSGVMIAGADKRLAELILDNGKH
jgi:UDP-N-acetylglucosamine--N-acetylmuramyl-(pentapeptide) pyrophosphoryl-undecaprenol N-acetylglucosamine transferase